MPYDTTHGERSLRRCDPRYSEMQFMQTHIRPPNDVRIDCKAAKHSDGDRGAVLAQYRDGRAGTAPPIERGLL